MTGSMNYDELDFVVTSTFVSINTQVLKIFVDTASKIQMLSVEKKPGIAYDSTCSMCVKIVTKYN